MKITFEGNFVDLIGEVEKFLAVFRQKSLSEKPSTTALPMTATFEGPGPDTAAFNPVPKINTPVAKPVQPADKPVAKSKPVKPPPTAKQLAAVEKMRAAKEAKKAAAVPKQTTVEDLLEKVAKAEAKKAEAPPLDPAEVVKLRTKTIEDLQQAYADGHQKEVFELLSRFGNGAKSFRELPADAFLPIREAIDNGALT
jgi:hypothetical protein